MLVSLRRLLHNLLLGAVHGAIAFGFLLVISGFGDFNFGPLTKQHPTVEMVATLVALGTSVGAALKRRNIFGPMPFALASGLCVLALGAVIAQRFGMPDLTRAAMPCATAGGIAFGLGVTWGLEYVRWVRDFITKLLWW